MSEFTFDPKTTAYSTKNAFALSRAALLAYGCPEQVALVVKQWGMQGFHSCDNRGTQAFIVADDTKIIVAFRGTEPTKLEDWFTNIQASKIKLQSGFPRFQGSWSGVSVHKGFLEALQHVWKRPIIQHDVFATIKQFRTNHQTIWLTGHSLGAALATLAAAKLWWEDGIAINGLYTFGSPKVGDSLFARAAENSFGARTFRFVNHDDIVSRIPSSMRGYKHVGTLRYFDAVGNLRPTPSWWDRLKQKFKSGPGYISDHSMVGYHDLLFRLAQSNK